MQRYTAYAATAAGTHSASATVTVYNAGTLVQASIFSDNLTTPTVQANPLTTDANGYFTFYARNGRYDVRLSGGTPAVSPAITYGDQLLYDPFDAVAGQLTLQAVDVRAYGARADGATDDTAAIRAALSALSATGGVVLLPAKSTILVSDALTFQGANTEIRGGGPSTVLQMTADTKDMFKAAVGGCAVRDIAIAKSVADTAGNLLTLTAGGDNFLLENVYSTTWGRLLNATSIVRPTIRHIRASASANGGTAMTVSGTTDARIEDATFLGFSAVLSAISSSHRLKGLRWYLEAAATGAGTAVSITSSNDVDLVDVTIAGTSAFSGGFSATSSTRVRLSDWSILTAPTGADTFTLASSTRASLETLRLIGIPAGRNAITLTSSSDEASVRKVVGNGALSFLNVVDSKYFLAESCSWTGAATNVAAIGGTSTYWQIEDCDFYTNLTGVVANQGATWGEISNTIVSGGTGAFAVGVELLGAQFCTVRACTFAGNNNGIHLENAGLATTTWANFAQLVGNYCYNNRQDGIFTQNHQQTLVVGNLCIGNGRHGINIAGGTSITIKGNACLENGQTDVTGAGIACATTNGLLISGNTCSRQTVGGQTLGSQKYGIIVDSTNSTGLIDGNMATGNVTANISNTSTSVTNGLNQTA